MKLVCIDNKNYEIPFITIGKEYECIKEDNEYYYILEDDNNINIISSKHLFITLDEYRNKKLEEIGI